MEQMNFISEVDTHTQTLRAAYEQFGDIVCCIFEHETVSQLRRQNNEFIEIRSPRIAMLLAGLRLDKLLMHAAMVFQMMPELKATPMGEIGGQHAPTPILPNTSHGLHQTRRCEASSSPWNIG